MLIPIFFVIFEFFFGTSWAIEFGTLLVFIHLSVGDLALVALNMWWLLCKWQLIPFVNFYLQFWHWLQKMIFVCIIDEWCFHHCVFFTFSVALDMEFLLGLSMNWAFFRIINFYIWILPSWCWRISLFNQLLFTFDFQLLEWKLCWVHRWCQDLHLCFFEVISFLFIVNFLWWFEDWTFLKLWNQCFEVLLWCVGFINAIVVKHCFQLCLSLVNLWRMMIVGWSWSWCFTSHRAF